MKFFRRRFWRSVAFRSGVIAAVMVGLIAFVAATFVSMQNTLVIDAVSLSYQNGQLDLVTQQLFEGSDYDEIVLPLAEGSTSFDGFEIVEAWIAVVLDGEVVTSEGPVDPRLFDEPYEGDSEELIFDIDSLAGSESDFEFELDIDISEQNRAELEAEAGTSLEEYLIRGGVLIDRPDGGFDLGEDEEFGDVSVANGLQSYRYGNKRLDDALWSYTEQTIVLDNGDKPLVALALFQKGSGDVELGDQLQGWAMLILPGSVFVGLLAAWLTSRALRQVSHMQVEVEQITQRSLERRVPVSNAGDVVDRLAHTMNDMLARLDEAATQQTRFMADASHELRSPVAGLLAQLDVASTYPDKIDAAALLPDLRDEAKRLQLLVNDLLYLSRTEGETLVDPDAVVVDDMLAAEVEHQRLLNPDLTIEHGARSGEVVGGRERDLTRAVRNLMSNAARHCEGRVEVGAEVIGDQLIITVRDDGPGVPPEAAAMIFDRFVRLDEARSRDAGGAGLGLAITSEIVFRHGGSVVLDADAGPGAVFRISLPRSGV